MNLCNREKIYKPLNICMYVIEAAMHSYIYI